MAIPVTNFGLVTVSALYDSAATSIVLQSGDGSRLPSTFPYPLTWWNATDYAHPADDPNREIVSVTNRSSDTLTIARAQEGTSASSKNTSGKTYRMSLGVTKAMWESLQVPKQSYQGLQLQTHRDSDKQASQVEIVGVDSIIMDDGVELRNDNGEWNGITADITVSGAGGLDTGAEDVSVWYEIYAIAKEDGTRNLLLHTSKVWAVDTNYVSGEDASAAIRSSSSTNVKVAQGFQVNNSGTCPYIQAKLIRVGSPTGKIWFTIETSSGGNPSGTAVATSQAYDVSRIPTSGITLRFPMKTSNTLSASPTQYHLVAQGDWTANGTDYIAWRADSTSAAYGSGAMSTFGTTWSTSAGWDTIFDIAIELNNGAVTMPSGYTKKCFLGWVFNDGSSNFRPFLQVQQARRNTVIDSTADSAWITNGSAELIDLLQFLPPRQTIKAILAFTGTSTSAGLIAIGDLRAADISSGGTTVGAQTVIMSAATTTRPSEFKEVFVQCLAIMAMGTSGGHLWVTGFEW